LVCAKEKAEESDLLKSAFLANMSHEIRTPMNGILGFVELLKEPKLTGEELKEYIRIIDESGKRMLNIINDIICISKVEAGQNEVVSSETNINDHLRYIFTFFKRETEQKGIELSYQNGLSDFDANVLTDKEKVYAIITNLVKNAIKFTHSGSIKFGYVKKGKYLEFYVRDTGVGIRTEQQKVIFERFRQASESLSRQYEGAGLGLAISKAYVEMLGGEIWVESDPEGTNMEKGSVFYFSIPYVRNNFNEIELDSNQFIPLEKCNIKKLKILIADDDPVSEIFIGQLVRTFSKEILIENTGHGAVDACKNHPDIDLVLMDIQMPDTDGYEATRQIREFNREVVIIAQTALGLKGEREKVMAAGCTDYLSKPIAIAAFTAMIRKYFETTE
jgi:CheY-like chemotaxis protein